MLKYAYRIINSNIEIKSQETFYLIEYKNVSGATPLCTNNEKYMTKMAGK